MLENITNIKFFEGELSEPVSFHVESGVLRVTDPCYTPSTWCAGTLDKVKTGDWLAKVAYYKDPLDVAQMVERLSYLEERLGKEVSTFEFNQAKSKFESYKGHVARLQIAHQEYSEELFAVDLENGYEDSGIDVGVDSGQAGFFDQPKYDGLFGNGENAGHNQFYKIICDKTLDNLGFGAVEFGVAASSGYGDGGYSCLIKRNSDGELISAMILFIFDEEADEYDDEEADEYDNETEEFDDA